MAKNTQEKNSSQTAHADIASEPGLDDLIWQEARRIIQQAIEAELAAMLEQYSNVKTINGQRAVVRNGYLPEREIVTAVGPVTVQVPKVPSRNIVESFVGGSRVSRRSAKELGFGCAPIVCTCADRHGS